MKKHLLYHRGYSLTDGSGGAIVVAATAILPVTTAAVLAFSVGRVAVEVGGGMRDDSWNIVDYLVIEGCTVR